MTTRAPGALATVLASFLAAILTVLVHLPVASAAADGRGTELAPPRGDLATILLPATSELDAGTRALIEDAESWVRSLDGGQPDLGEAYGSLGRVYLASSFDVAARECFANAAALEPGRFQWQYYKGYAALRTADLDVAARALEAASKMRPDDLPARTRLGVAYRRAGRLGEARQAFQQVLERSEEHAYAHAALGNLELEEKNWSKGIEHLEAALRLQPQATSLYNPLALAYRQIGDRDRAKSLLEKRGVGVVAMADPLLDEARRLAAGTQLLLHRGSAAARQGRVEEALDIFEEALRADPGNAIAHYNVGALYLARQETERAIVEFRQAIELDPDYQIAYLNLGSVFSRLGRYDEALEHLERALEIDPGDPATRQNLANALVRAGRCPAAIDHYIWLVERDPTMEAGWLGQVQCLGEAGDYAAALGETRKGLDAAPRSVRLRESEVRLLAASPDAAVRDAAAAVRLGEALFAESRSLGPAEALAMAYAEAGRFTDAIRVQGMAVEGARRGRRQAQSAVLDANLRLYEAGEPCREPWR